MNCRYDDGAYVQPDGEQCRVDDYGDPTNHCTCRRTCSQHVGYGELTCARCIGRARTNIRRLIEVAPFATIVATEGKTTHDALSLAGPTATFSTWEHRFGKRRIEIMDAYPDNDELALKHLGKLDQERDDEEHPTLLFARWVEELSDAWGLKAPKLTNIATLGDWLDDKLGKFAQDPEQEFWRFAKEVRECLNHVENELTLRRSSKTVGVSCPTCAGVGVKARLVRLYGHWCEDPDCERIHVADESRDVWRCPRNRDHEWSPKSYRDYLEERQGA